MEQARGMGMFNVKLAQRALATLSRLRGRVGEGIAHFITGGGQFAMPVSQIVRYTGRTLFLVFGLMAVLPLPVFAVDTGNGQRLYQLHCSGCHGDDGISVMKDAPNIASFELFSKPDQTLIDAIRSGKNVMPPYFGILNDSEILDVIGYLRTLR